MADLPTTIAASREADKLRFKTGMTAAEAIRIGLDKEKALRDLLDALDAAQGGAVLFVKAEQLADHRVSGMNAVRAGHQDHARGLHTVPLYLAPQAPPAAVAAANVTPMRQPRADLARLVESINVAVYANGYGLSVTEAIGALELAKLELLKEQEQ